MVDISIVDGGYKLITGGTTLYALIDIPDLPSSPEVA